jgi:glycosyltransferase involved in cell wall biosynthesis
MKVALVHDHLLQAGGAERVVEVLHGMFPDAPIFTAMADRSILWPGLRDADIRTSWMQHLPGVKQAHRAFFPFFPAAIESFDLREYDLVISSSFAFAKGAVTRPDAHHVCYCHTPMRFAWSYDSYVEREDFGPIVRQLLPPLVRRVKEWDVRTANRPTTYIANSTVVAHRIRRCYGRPARVVHPPVSLDRYAPGQEDGDYYLIVSRLVPYKRIDLAIAAFNALSRRLVIVGDGPARRSLQRLAGPTIEFTGRIPDADVARHYAACMGLVFPGEEDFGIAPLEANASGRPVVAYRAGGALDTVRDGRSGVFFDEPTVSSLCEAVRRCDALPWDRQTLRRHAGAFTEAVFRRRFMETVDTALANGGQRARAG